MHTHTSVLEIGGSFDGFEIDTRIGLHGIQLSQLSLQSGGVDKSLLDKTLGNPISAMEKNKLRY